MTQDSWWGEDWLILRWQYGLSFDDALRKDFERRECQDRAVGFCRDPFPIYDNDDSFFPLPLTTGRARTRGASGWATRGVDKIRFRGVREVFEYFYNEKLSQRRAPFPPIGSSDWLGYALLLPSHVNISRTSLSPTRLVLLSE